MLILISTLIFWIFNSKSIFGEIWAKKSQSCTFFLKNWHTCYLEDADSYAIIIFLNFQPEIHFYANLDQKKSKLSVLPENWHTWYLEDADSYSDISFLNFQLYIHFWGDLDPGRGIFCFV